MRNNFFIIGNMNSLYLLVYLGKDLSTAFSAQTLLAGLSGGVCFFMFGVLSKDSIAAITVGNGLLAIATYFLLVGGLMDPNKPVTWSQLCSQLITCGRARSDTTDLREPLLK